LGAHQTPETLPELLLRLRATVGKGGLLLFTMIDPLDTADAAHLRYHRRNVQAGKPPGLIRMRIRYKDQIDQWMDLWMLTDDELNAAASLTGWTILKSRSSGPWRVRLLANLSN
jgi:hypothetical protein